MGRFLYTSNGSDDVQLLANDWLQDSRRLFGWRDVGQRQGTFFLDLKKPEVAYDKRGTWPVWKKTGFPGWQPRQRLCQFLGDGHQLSSIQECGCCYSWWIPHIVDSSNLICCVVSIYGPTTCWTGWEGITPLHWWDFPPGTPNPVIWRRDHSPRLTMIFHIWYPLVN